MNKFIFKFIFTCIVISLFATLSMAGCGNTSESGFATSEVTDSTIEEAEETTANVSVEGALADGTYMTTALTTHYATNCLAGIDYDSLYDITFTVENGLFATIEYDIGVNSKSVPETAEVSMEDWAFIKLSEEQAQNNLIGQPATEEAITEAWQIENREELLEQGIDATSGATEACRATRDAIINVVTMNESGHSYVESCYAKDIVPQIKMFTGTVTNETVDENGRTSETVQIDDGEYTLYGIVSANNNEIDNTAVDYNYIIQVDVKIADGNIQDIACTTPNGSEDSQKAVEEADAIVKEKLVGVAATNDAISENIPYNSEETFEGSVEAQIACDMISSILKNGYTHVVGWSY